MTELMTEEGTGAGVDPVALEVLRHQAQAICEEMSYTLQRTSHTVFVNETADFATGLATTEGELFARLAPPRHEPVRAGLRRGRAGRLRLGLCPFDRRRRQSPGQYQPCGR